MVSILNFHWLVTCIIIVWYNYHAPLQNHFSFFLCLSTILANQHHHPCPRWALPLPQPTPPTPMTIEASSSKLQLRLTISSGWLGGAHCASSSSSGEGERYFYGCMISTYAKLTIHLGRKQYMVTECRLDYSIFAYVIPKVKVIPFGKTEPKSNELSLCLDIFFGRWRKWRGWKYRRRKIRWKR